MKILAVALLLLALPAEAAISLSVKGDPATGPWCVEGTTTDTRSVQAAVYLDGRLDGLATRSPCIKRQFGAGSHAVEFRYQLLGTTTEIERKSITVVEVAPPPPPPPPPGAVTFTLVGDPANSPWGLAISIEDSRDTMMDCWLDGNFQHHENQIPYGFPNDGQTGTFGNGPHTIECVFLLQDTTTEVGRKSITVTEGSAPPTPAVCGDGVLNGTEVCDGPMGCGTGTCNATCSACVAPPPPPPAEVCLAPTPGTSLTCVTSPTGTMSKKCTFKGQLVVEACPGVPALGAKTCLTLPTASLLCDPEGTEYKCRLSTKAIQLEDCR